MLSENQFPIDVEPNSLLVIGGRPGIGITALGLSWILNAEEKRKGHFISLYATLESLERGFTETKRISKSFVEQSTTLQLVEHIVQINAANSPDYFVIDSLEYIGREKPKFFHQDKKYQKQLRHLRALAQAMNKPILLLTTLDHSIEEYDPFTYHRLAHREKYADYVFILYRWEYYQEPLLLEDGTRLEKNQSLLIIGKSPNEKDPNYSILTYDPRNRLFKKN